MLIELLADLQCLVRIDVQTFLLAADRAYPDNVVLLRFLITDDSWLVLIVSIYGPVVVRLVELLVELGLNLRLDDDIISVFAGLLGHAALILFGSYAGYSLVSTHPKIVNQRRLIPLVGRR